MKEQERLNESIVSKLYDEEQIKIMLNRLKRRYKNILFESELQEIVRNFIEIAEIFEETNIELKTDNEANFYLDLYNGLAKPIIFDESIVSELYDEELIKSVIDKLKRKYKYIFPEFKLHKVARHFIKIMKILKKTTTGLEKKEVNITLLWVNLIDEFDVPKLHDEELIEVVVSGLKRKYKDILPEAELREMARKLNELIAIIEESIIGLEEKKLCF